MKAKSFTEETPDLIHPIDFAQMKMKSYETFSQFEEDIKWFIHNCRTMFPRDQNVQNAAKKLMKYYEKEIHSIQTCEECYNNAYDHGDISFTLPCENPHLLIWAKAAGYGYWLAKAMYADNENEMILVRFFGDHTTLDLPESDCFLYSEEYPLDTNESTSYEYNLAITVTINYL